MDLKVLETFVKVCDLGSITAAAEALQMTQPGASKQVHRLEAALGCALLTRVESGVQLTDKGREAYHRAKTILREWNQLAAHCQNPSSTLTGELRIAASSIPSKFLLPSRLTRFHHAYPAVELMVQVCDSEQALDLLAKQSVDLACVGMKPQSPEMVAVPFAQDRLVVIAPTEIHQEFSWRESPFILRESGSGTRQATEQVLRDLGVSVDTLKRAAQANDPDLILQMVEKGLGVAVVSGFQAEDAMNSGKRVQIVEELPERRQFYTVRLRNREEEALIHAFLSSAMAV